MKTPQLTLVLIALAAPCAAQSMFRGDAAHSGASAAAGPHSLKGVKWAFPTGARVVSSPVVAADTLYIGSDDGNLYALDPATGVQRWKFTTAGPVSSTPAVAEGVVFFGSYDGRFYAVDALTGKLKWRFATEGERRFEAKGLHGMLPKNQTIADPYDLFLSSPVVAEKAVVFGSGDGHLYALEAATGMLRWKFAAGDVIHASPAYADGRVYVGSWDSILYAVDLTKGSELWRFKAGEDPYIHNQVGFQSSPAVAGGTVYVGCRDSKLYALDAKTGRQKWQVDNQGSWVVGSPAVVRGKVVYATSDSSLFHVVDAETGKSLVKEDVRAFVFASPTVAGDVVYLGITNGSLEARELETGHLLWSFATEASRRNPGWVLTSERRFNQPLLFYSPWREVPLLGQDRQLSVGSFVSTPLVAGGLVFVGSTDGNVYALY
jgi:outer membrane protein assembly factor BamB